MSILYVQSAGKKGALGAREGQKILDQLKRRGVGDVEQRLEQQAELLSVKGLQRSDGPLFAFNGKLFQSQGGPMVRIAAGSPPSPVAPIAWTWRLFVRSLCFPPVPRSDAGQIVDCITKRCTHRR
jgi:hypothetical protein